MIAQILLQLWDLGTAAVRARAGSLNWPLSSWFISEFPDQCHSIHQLISLLAVRCAIHARDPWDSSCTSASLEFNNLSLSAVLLFPYFAYPRLLSLFPIPNMS